MSAGDDILLLLALGLGGYAIYKVWSDNQAIASPAPVATDPQTAAFTTVPDPNATPSLTVSDILLPSSTGAPMSVTTTSSAGRQRIKGFEGLKLTAYADAGGQSIGYGHFITASDHIKSPITQAQADSLFNNDITNVERDLNATVRVPLNQNQFDALADLIYEIGTTQWGTSTLLSLLNQGSYNGAQQQFARWIYSQGVENADMVKRRASDAALFGTQASLTA